MKSTSKTNRQHSDAVIIEDQRQEILRLDARNRRDLEEAAAARTKHEEEMRLARNRIHQLKICGNTLFNLVQAVRQCLLTELAINLHPIENDEKYHSKETVCRRVAFHNILTANNYEEALMPQSIDGETWGHCDSMPMADREPNAYRQGTILYGPVPPPEL